MTKIAYGSDVNLKELHCQLAGRIALLLIGVSGLVMWRALYWFWMPFPAALFGLSIALVGLGVSVRALVKARPVLARHLMVWGLTGGLLVAMGLLPEPWIPFLGLMVVFVGAMLIGEGGVVTAGVIAVAAVWLTRSGARAYPLPGVLASLVLGVALAWLVVHTLYTALEWAWTMQQRADHLLEQSRDHQGELTRALKSLDLTNTILRRTQRELIAARRQAEEARRLTCCLTYSSMAISTVMENSMNAEVPGEW